MDIVIAYFYWLYQFLRMIFKLLSYYYDTENYSLLLVK